MRLPESVRAVAALCSDRSVRVTMASGETFTLPIPPAPPPAEPPHPLETASKQLLERDLETRATVASVMTRMDETVHKVQEAVARVSAEQNQLAEGLKSVVETLSLPVKPVYDKKGKLIGAERVRK